MVEFFIIKDNEKDIDKKKYLDFGSGIAVNSIQAGVTDTPALRKIPGNEQMIKNAKNINPGKRLTTPNDVAQYIALLGLTEETWLTGNTIRVDGGEDITG